MYIYLSHIVVGISFYNIICGYSQRAINNNPGLEFDRFIRLVARFLFKRTSHSGGCNCVYV